MASGSEKGTQIYKLISEIKKYETGWTAKVIVAEKAMPRTSRSPTKHQSLLLLDPKGNEVRATIYSNNIQAFEDTLQVAKTYLLSNATVKEAKAEYRKRDDELHWTINARTMVQELDESHDHVLQSVYNFSPLANIQSHMDKKTEINILAVVIDIRPKRHVNTDYGTAVVQELVLVDEKFNTVMLTMWDTFTENECNAISAIIHKKPIIAGLHLRVVSFNGINIQTKSSSCIIIEPQFESARLLRTWVTEHTSRLNTMIDNRQYLGSSISLRRPADDQIVSIKDINDMLLMRTNFWVSGIISIKNYDQSFWYMSCDKCCKTTGYDNGDLFECLYCKSRQAKATPRAKIEVELSDSTGSLLAIVFGHAAEKLYSCTSDDLMNLKAKAKDRNSLESLFKLSDGGRRIVYLKSSKKDHPTVETQKFTITCFFTETDKSSTKLIEASPRDDSENTDQSQKKQKLDHPVSAHNTNILASGSSDAPEA